MNSPYARLIGEPCESVRRLGNRACGEPSRFLYRGIEPRVLNLTAVARKKYIRTVLLMCVDCAKSIAEDFAWQIKDGHVRLESLDMVKHRMFCRTCHISVQLIWPDGDPQGNPGTFEFCPRCGASTSIPIVDPEADYFDLVAESFPGMPLQLVKMLYAEWPRSSRWPRFR